MPSLYIVSTPIGNLEDVTFRAVRILNNVDVIAAEDTRVTRKLLTHYDIHTRVISYNDNNRNKRIPYIMGLLKSKDVALVSDAGTPVISDPGLELVQACVEQEFNVVPVPGPSAATTSLSISGFSGREFLFLGFLPANQGRKRKLLETTSSLKYPIILFEAPHRLKKTLSDLIYVLGNRKIAVVREVTKFYEEVYRGSISECQEHFGNPKGEFTLIVQGSHQTPDYQTEDIYQMFEELVSTGCSSKEAREIIFSRTKISRREIYRISISKKQSTLTP